MKFPFNAPPLVGVDIGSRFIKGVELEKQNHRVHLKNVFFQDLATSTESYPDFPNLADSLAAAVEVNHFQKKKVSVALNTANVDSVDFTIPKIPDKEIASVVRFEVEKRVNMVPIDELSYDYVILDDEKDKDKIHVKVYFTIKDNLIQFLDMVEKACLIPKQVDIDILSLLNTLDFNGYLDVLDNNLLIDMGENHTTIAIIKGKSLGTFSTTPFSFGMINQALMENLEINYNEAEQLKIGYNLFAEKDEKTEKEQIVEQAFVHFFDNIQETMDHFIERSNRPVQKVLLTGGGSKKEDIRSVIEHHYHIDTVQVNPLKNIEIFDKEMNEINLNEDRIIEITPFLSTSIGLALRGVLDE